MSPKFSSDRILSWLFVIGLVFIAFVAGAVSLHYRIWVARPVVNAIAAGEALRDQWSGPASLDAPTSGPQYLASIEQAFAHSHVTWNEAKALGGYTLVALRYSTSVYLVDMQGRLVHRWDLPFDRAFPHPTHVHGLARAVIYIERAHAFPNGDLLVSYTGWRDTPYGYGLAKFDKDSQLLWAYAANVHHGFTVDRETGNIHTMSQEFINSPIDGLADLALPVLADALLTLSPDGRELEKLPLLEAFRDSPYASMLYHRPISGLDWDLFHTNAVERLEPDMATAFPMFKTGDLLVSIRNMNTVAVVDPRVRRVVWAYNGIWQGQHAAHFLPNGRILLLDNFGYFSGRPSSRVLEFDPATLQVTWEFTGSPAQRFYTYAYGRAQRLSNGDTLIADTLEARVLEVASDGQVVWDFALPQEFRAFQRDLPPYKKDISRAALADPGFAESYKTLPNLATAVVDATRYSADEMRFLRDRASKRP